MTVTMRTCALAATLAALVLAHDSPLDAHHSRVQVLRRLRLGNHGEDITYVGSGRHQGHLAAINGWDVVATSLDERDDCPERRASGDHSRRPETLFDVRGLGIGVDSPRGIEYVPTQRRFYFGTAEPELTDRLFVTDEDGRPLPPLPLTYPAGVDPLRDVLQFEGLSYIPPSSAVFPDHLVAITLRQPDFSGVVEIIRFDRAGRRVVGGTIVSEIAFDPTSPLNDAFASIQYAAAPDRLLISGTNAALYQTLFELHFDGTFAGPLATLPDMDVIEGIAALPGGRLALADSSLARVAVLGMDFRRHDEPIDLTVGIGVDSPHGLAWNPDAREFLTVSRTQTAPIHDRITAFTLRSARAFAADDPRLFFVGDAAYVPGDAGAPARVAVANRTTAFRGLFLYDANGDYASRIRTRGVILPAVFNVPQVLAALPGGRFAYSSFSIFPIVELIAPGGPDATDPTSVLASETGRIVLDADETPRHPAQVGGGLSAVDFGGDALLSGNAFYDLGGNRLAEVDLSALGLNYVDGGTQITNGPFAGAFAVVEKESSTIVIFRFER